MENLAKRVSVSKMGGWAMVAVLMVSSVACGPMEASTESMATPSTQAQALDSQNGLTLNGLSVNGLTLNGLTLNGLTLNGLMTSDFAAWFARDVALNNNLMKYVVQCALPTGESRTFQDQESGASYTWQGGLGLALGWARGESITEVEQQLVSACLAAHVNKFGMHVPLSVLGMNAQQEPIAYSRSELETFARRESCFFGNLFTGEGIFVGVDRDYLNESESSPRACGLTTQEGESASACSPMVHVNSCETLCTLDESGLFYTECSYNGQTYRPLTTRIRSDDVYACGDGVCQFTESCGLNDSASSCFSDCGACQ